MPQINPIAFIVSHKEIILPIYQRCEGKTKRAWDDLKQTLPETHEVMKFNTFKQYLSVMSALMNNLDKADDEKKEVRQTLDSFPKRISGWSVQKATDGYYRCYRKIDKRVHSIYIGKELNMKKARRRIKEKEIALGLDRG